MHDCLCAHDLARWEIAKFNDSSLKAACGSGGTVKDGTVEVQGDHCERVKATLKAQGFVVKRSGGYRPGTIYK